MDCSGFFIVCSMVAVFPTVAGCADQGSLQPNTTVNAAQPEAIEATQNSNDRTVQADPNVVTIPLDQVRHGGAGRQLRDLEPEFFAYRDTPEKIAKYSTPEGLKEIEKIRQRAAEGSLVLGIERAMQSMLADKNAQAGFAVEGRDRTALQGVYDVLVKGNKPQERFASKAEVSVVFFTLNAQPAVRLDRVQRKGSVIEIRYMLISHGRMLFKWNLALIPLGKLPPGKYHVEMIRSVEKEKDRNQSGFSPVTPGFESGIVCRPFDFVVTD